MDSNIGPKSESNTFKEELKKEDFRVTIFGSARIKKDDKWWGNVHDIAKEIGKRKWDLITGGGPGLMDAANTGHMDGDPNDESDSIGLTIELPWEAGANKHLDLHKHFEHFSNRLDNFMALSNAVIVMPGGIGTCLELFYTWQLIQVKHICPMPIILFGEEWHSLIEWVKEHPLKQGLVSPKDMDNIHCVDTKEDAFKILDEVYEKFKKDPDFCNNLKKFNLKD